MFEAQFLVDRKNEYYYVPRDTLHLPRPNGFATFHTGTLLDGELVRQKFPGGRERLKYLIFDCLAIDGEDITNRPFDKRLSRIDRLIAKPLREFSRTYPTDIEAAPFEVEMKQMELPYGMEMMFRDRIPHLPHGNDGLIFTCKDTPYVAGTDTHILKWKPPQENTIDFRLLLGDFPWLEDEDGAYEDWDAKPTLELHVNHGGGSERGYQFFAPLHITDQEWSNMKFMNQPLDGRVIECFRDPALKQWRPKIEENGMPRFRDDKKDANHVSVVESVVESIEDAVTEQDLIAAAAGIKTAFKARQKARDEEARRLQEVERRRAVEAAAKAKEVAAQQQQQRRESIAKQDDDVTEDDPDAPRYDD